MCHQTPRITPRFTATADDAADDRRRRICADGVCARWQRGRLLFSVMWEENWTAAADIGCGVKLNRCANAGGTSDSAAVVGGGAGGVSASSAIFHVQRKKKKPRGGPAALEDRKPTKGAIPMLPVFASEEDARRWLPPSPEFLLYRVSTPEGNRYTWALTLAQAFGQVAFWLGFFDEAETMED